MGDYHTFSGNAFAERSLLSLVGEHTRLPAKQAALLEPFFVIKRITPADALGLSQTGGEEKLGETQVILVLWDEQSPAVICALKDLARRSAVPIIALCRTDEAEHVAALMIGADDALTYPVSPVLLQARLRAYQRLVNQTGPLPPATTVTKAPDETMPRISPMIPQDHEVCTVGALKLDRTARRFFADGRPIELTPKEFDLMEFMMQRVGACLSRDELLDQIWGIDYDAETNVLGTQMYTLRRKLASYGLGEAIQTVRGVGYRLAANPHTMKAA